MPKGDNIVDVERKNASAFPKFYYAKHMINGLCGYDDETVLIDRETMKRMMNSMNGKPVYNYKHDERTNEERLQDIKETACGYVADTFIDERDGWMWSKLMIIDDEAHDNIASGAYKVSNAYIPTKRGAGGTHLNIPFDSQIEDAEFTHIALVTNPRYEKADIMSEEQYADYWTKELTNSKPELKGTIMKFFKTEKKEVTAVDADTSIELTNSKGETVEVTVAEMINAVEAANAKKNAPKIKVGDKEMTVEELVNSYQSLNAKKNSDESKKDEKDNEDEVEEKDEEMENEDEDDADEKKKAKENKMTMIKMNCKSFKRNMDKTLIIE